MSFEDNVATNAMIMLAKRVNAKKGDAFRRVEYASLAQHQFKIVKVTRVTKNWLQFSDGGRMNKSSGAVDSEGIVSYMVA
jgi:hypothetical protein